MRHALHAFFLCLLLGLFACASPGGGSASASPGHPSGKGAVLGDYRARFVAWNVANFFDTKGRPNETVLTQVEYDGKIAEIAAVLDGLDADFVGLVEVETIGCLEDLNKALQRPYRQLGLIEGNDRQRGIDVAFLSRLPVEQVISHKEHDLPDAPGVSRNYKFSRDCLEVRLATSPPTTLFVNHFKSQLGGKKDSAAKRRVQAQAVVEIAAATARQLPDGLEVVMGDLNDRPESWSLEPVMEAFVDVYGGWPEGMRATHRSRRGATPLDYILISKNATARMEEPKVWQNAGRLTSDHDPVSVRLRLDGKPPTVEKSRVWMYSDK